LFFFSSLDDKLYEPDGRLYPGYNDQTLDRKILQLNHPFTIMVEENSENLLDHPLVHSLLEYKWRLFASYFYYFNFLFYLLFVASLTIYVLLAFPPFHFGITQTQMQESTCEELCLFIKANRTEEINNYQFRINTISIFKWFVIILAAMQLVKESVQIITQRLDYITLENAVELPAFILAIVFAIDLNRCARDIGYRCVFQWQLGALSILLTWFALVLFMKKFPRFGIFVVMFTDILRTFSRFFLVFFLFIIGFALAFHMLLQNHNPFQHFGNSLLKTCVMMIGEFEYEGTRDRR
jgi:transient receptor potential cation channel subfamily A protein 1